MEYTGGNIAVAGMQGVESMQRIVQPYPGGQEKYLSLSPLTYEAMFGGEAGPGKTWGGVIDALGLQFESSRLGMRAIDVPSYRAVCFRRESGDLSGLLDEMHKYYPDFGGVYTGRRTGDPGPCYTFPSGARIWGCHMKDEEDKRNHKGKEYQYIFFDEVSQFTITQYLYLFSKTI